MNLKIGDKVKMTPRGFRFYSNIDIQFDMGNVGGKMNGEHFTMAVCEQFAIHGVGVIKGFNDSGDPYIRWHHSLDGLNYHYSHYYDTKDVKKLNFIDKLIIKLRNLV